MKSKSTRTNPPDIKDHYTVATIKNDEKVALFRRGDKNFEVILLKKDLPLDIEKGDVVYVHTSPFFDVFETKILIKGIMIKQGKVINSIEKFKK